MSTRRKTNFSLYRENARPRQLRGYLAYCGLEGALDRLADEVSTVRARRAFLEAVPADVGESCEVLLFKDGEFRIHADKPGVASWLRNRQQRIVDALRERHVGVNRLRLVVSPSTRFEVLRPVAKPDRPPPDAAKLIRESASHVTHSSLKKALARLADRLEKFDP
jgi:hypothetical protein